MGRTYFEYNDYEQRQIERSSFRNNSSNCMYCAYKYKPSTSMSGSCQGCPSKLIMKKDNGTE